MTSNHSDIERRFWVAADEFLGIYDLNSYQDSTPELGLVFLRYTDHKCIAADKELAGKGLGRCASGKEGYQIKGVMYRPRNALYPHMLAIPEGESIGQAIYEAMRFVEARNEERKSVLPRPYTKIDNSVLDSLSRTSRGSLPMKKTRSGRFTDTSVSTSLMWKVSGVVNNSRRLHWSS